MKNGSRNVTSKSLRKGLSSFLLLLLLAHMAVVPKTLAQTQTKPVKGDTPVNPNPIDDNSNLQKNDDDDGGESDMGEDEQTDWNNLRATTEFKRTKKNISYEVQSTEYSVKGSIYDKCTLGFVKAVTKIGFKKNTEGAVLIQRIGRSTMSASRRLAKYDQKLLERGECLEYLVRRHVISVSEARKIVASIEGGSSTTTTTTTTSSTVTAPVVKVVVEKDTHYSNEEFNKFIHEDWALRTSRSYLGQEGSGTVICTGNCIQQTPDPFMGIAAMIGAAGGTAVGIYGAHVQALNYQRYVNGVTAGNQACWNAAGGGLQAILDFQLIQEREFQAPYLTSDEFPQQGALGCNNMPMSPFYTGYNGMGMMNAGIYGSMNPYMANGFSANMMNNYPGFNMGNYTSAANGLSNWGNMNMGPYTDMSMYGNQYGGQYGNQYGGQYGNQYGSQWNSMYNNPMYGASGMSNWGPMSMGPYGNG